MSDDMKTVTRSFHIERLKADDQITYRASLSSESPVRDFPFMPPVILRHVPDAVDLSEISERGLPLVANHGMMNSGMEGIHNVIGRIRNIRLDRKRLVGDLVFSRANPNADLIRAMVDEGTLTDMSITAKTDKTRTVTRGNDEFIEALKWAPIEASVVGAGGDSAVGIGRSRQMAVTAEETAMSDDTKQADTKAANTDDTTDDKEQKVVQRIEQGRQAYDESRAIKLEEQRQQAIRNLAEANSIGEDTVQEWISRGYGLDQVADNILAIHKKRGESNQAKSHLGLTDKETRQYSLCRAILAAHSGKWDDAGFELECHEAVAREIKKVPDRGAFFVPLEVQRRALPTDMGTIAQRHQLGYLQRDLNVATAGEGGYLTQTVNMGFDELLRNISFAFRMGAQRLSGLRDNVTIPRQSAAATAEWLTSETDSPTESQQAFVQLSLSPKTVSAYTELSRQLLLQSTIDAEGLVNADLAAVAGLAVDAAVLNGSGASGQPEGLDTVTGVGTVTGTSLGFPGILEFQTDVASANVMPMRGGYVTTPAVASLMIQRVKYSSTASPLWEGNIWNGTMQGFPAMSTNQVAAATMYFGDWAKAVIAEWGVLEVETNPYANFPAGIIGVRAMYSVDVGIRYPAAFSKAATIT